MKKNQFSRRDFMKLTSFCAMPLMIGGIPIVSQALPRSFRYGADNDRILVLIQLQGGNDGLNMIYHNSQYDNLADVRSNIIIPENELLNIAFGLSLHPNMQGIKDLWDNEALQIIEAVGYPNQNRSHFRSSDIWNSGSSAEEVITTGWLGRFFDGQYLDFPNGYPNNQNPHPFALTMGNIVSETCQGLQANFSMAVDDPFSPGLAFASANGQIPDNCLGDALEYINNTIQQTNEYAEVIEDAANAGNNLSPKWDGLNTSISNKLKNVSRLISGGLQTKVYVVQIGGFDTHDDQVEDGAPGTGKHAVLLQQLSDAIAAFQDDIQMLGHNDKVLGMTYSEFGRRIRSNAGMGTDHGTAAPMMLFGTCVNQQMLGTAPIIDSDVGNSTGVPMQHDFRDIYGTILSQWLGVSSNEVSTILHPEFAALPLFEECCAITSEFSSCTGNFVRIALEGYLAADGLSMATELQTNNLIPSQQPFIGEPFLHDETLTVSDFPEDTVDWVLLEIRDAEDSAIILERRACLLRKDGYLMDEDGCVELNFEAIGQHRIAVYHRSHLGVLSSEIMEINKGNTWNFTSGVGQAFGNDQLKMVAGKASLFAGDFDSNNVINNVDFNKWAIANSAVFQYLTWDADGNGIINVADYNLWFANRSKVGAL